MAVKKLATPKRRNHQQYIKEHLDPLVPIFANAAVGDFNQDVIISNTEDEFTELYVGIEIMLEVIREKISNLEENKKHLLKALNDLAAEKAVVERDKAKDEALLESIGEGVIATDEKGIIIFVNRAAVTMLGIAEADFLDKEWIESLSAITDEHEQPIPPDKQP